mgnify:CR=1 FL=1
MAFKQRAKQEGPVARLTMVVEFDEIPDLAEVERIMDEARSYGAVKQVTWETLQLSKKELV